MGVGLGLTRSLQVNVSVCNSGSCRCDGAVRGSGRELGALGVGLVSVGLGLTRSLQVNVSGESVVGWAVSGRGRQRECIVFASRFLQVGGGG